MVETSKQIIVDTVKEFKLYGFTSVAIDEGATFGSKNVSFNLENPLSKLKPFTIKLKNIDKTDANGDKEVILSALKEIHDDFEINISACICDGKPRNISGT